MKTLIISFLIGLWLCFLINFSYDVFPCPKLAIFRDLLLVDKPKCYFSGFNPVGS